MNRNQQSKETTMPAATSWRDLYPPHPCADVYPMIEESELAALEADIKANGLRAPVVLWPVKVDGPWLILDGRNRLEALARLGFEFPPDPRKEVLKAWGIELSATPSTSIFRIVPPGTDPAGFVISANIHRRHLTKEQRGELIVKTIKAGKLGDRAKIARSPLPRGGGSVKDPLLAAAVAEGAKHGISKRTIQNARAKVNGHITATPKTSRTSARTRVVPRETPTQPSPGATPQAVPVVPKQSRHIGHDWDQQEALDTIDAAIRFQLSFNEEGQQFCGALLELLHDWCVRLKPA
jgi:hypothetical protein